MSIPLPDENPFAPPQALIGIRASEVDFDVDTDAELIRRLHLRHESSVKSIGTLAYLSALFGLFFAMAGMLAALGLIKSPPQQQGGSPELARVSMFIGVFVWGSFAVCGLVMGYGLRRLQVWARFTAMVLSVIFVLFTLAVGFVMALMFQGQNGPTLLVVLLVTTLIPAYGFFLLVAPKSNMVFSAEYRQVIARTPALASRTSLIVKILIGLVVALVVFMMAAMVWSVIS